MASLLGSEKTIVHDALLLFKGLITKRHLKDVSSLPRNGKSVSTPADDKEEQSVIDRLKGIDKILDKYIESDETKILSTKKTPPSNPYQFDIPAELDSVNDEPYLNPFTGKMVYPETPNTPGPSAVSKLSTGLSKDETQDNEISLDDRSYRTALRSAVALNHPPYSVSGRTISSSGPDESPRLPSHVQPQGIPSVATQINSETHLSLEIKSESLDNALKSFLDDFQSRETSESGPKSSRDPSIIPQHKNGYTVPAAQSRANVLEVPKSSSTHKASRHQTMDAPTLSSRNPFAPIVNNQKALSRVDLDTNDPRSRHNSGITSVGSNLSFLRENGKLDDSSFTGVDHDKTVAILLEQEEKQQYEMFKGDVKFASNLVADTSQDLIDFSEEQQNYDMQVQAELEAIQEQLHRQDREETEAMMAQLQAMQDEWNQSWEDSMQQQQILARQIVEQEQQKETVEAMREMRHWQEAFQSAERRQIEEDRRLALSLAEEDYDEQIQDDYLSSFASFDVSEGSREHLAANHNEAGVEIMPGGPRPVTNDRATTTALNTSDVPNQPSSITESFRQAQQLHQQWQSEWQSEIDSNAKAAHALQKEIEDLENQARRDLDHLRREHERQRQEEERQRQEAERRRVEEERQRKARMVECNVCGDEADREVTFRFPCTHAYCRECLNSSIDDALQSKRVFYCCRHRADPSMISQFLSTTKAGRYAGLVEELETPDPVYCSRRRCSAFVPPRDIQADTATCGKCGTRTCKKCKRESHAGICAQDQEGQALLALGEARKWKPCPRCKQLVERSSGCLHMTCRCGQDFCYNCGKSRCKGTCAR